MRKFLQFYSFVLAALLLACAVPVAQTISGVSPYTASGTLNTTSGAGSVVTLNIGGYTGVAVQLVGTCGTCTVNFEVTVDGTNWVATNLTPPDSTTPATSASAAGVWKGPANASGFRARMSARASGSFAATLRATAFN